MLSMSRTQRYSQYPLVTKPVQNRADHGPSRPDQICQFLLSDPQMLAEPMFAPPVETLNWCGVNAFSPYPKNPRTKQRQH
jgi:hypothetical protein